MRGWRNWQTHYFEGVANNCSCGFKSHSSHQKMLLNFCSTVIFLLFAKIYGIWRCTFVSASCGRLSDKKCWAAVEKFKDKANAPQDFSGTATGVFNKAKWQAFPRHHSVRRKRQIPFLAPEQKSCKNIDRFFVLYYLLEELFFHQGSTLFAIIVYNINKTIFKLVWICFSFL